MEINFGESYFLRQVMEIVKNNSDSSVSLWRNPCEVDQIKEGKHFFFMY